MRCQVYWVNERLGVMPRPRGGDRLVDEIASLREQGVTTVVSALTREEVAEEDLTEEEPLCASAGIEFLSIPISDHTTPPDTEAFARLVRGLTSRERVVIHCRAGIGRASMLAAGVLMAGGATCADAFERIAAARGLTVPETPEQWRWIETTLPPALRRSLSRSPRA